MKSLGLVILFASFIAAQHPVNPVVTGPLTVHGNALVDASGQRIILQGAVIPGLERSDPTTLATLTATTFSTMRQRWNMNALRLPVGIAITDPDYLPYVAEIVRKAN